MKRTTWINKIMLSSLLILTLIGTLLFYLPNTIAFSAPGDIPTITISSPSPNAGLKNLSVMVSGTYSDENVTTKEDLLFTAFDQTDESSQKTEISNSIKDVEDWNISAFDSNGKGTWAFTKTLSEGKHNLSIEIKEKTTPTNANQASIDFTVGGRPYISSTIIVLANNDEHNAEDFTSVPKDARVKITLVDDKPMDQLVSKIQANDNPYNPIKVMLGQDQISGKATIESTTQSGKYIYNVLFTPSNPLTLNKSYLVYVDPGLVDDSNNPIFSKFFKFTTKGDMDEADNPHGHYSLNTNMCANCHSTHIGTSDFLDGGSYQATSNQLNKDPGKSYCMACHDGTLNAPIADKINSTHQHNNPEGTNSLKKPDSCTSCHNPHKDWAEENPNMLKDHYVYTHNATHPDKGLVSAKVDSLDTTCNTCHENNEIVSNATYEVLSYKKSTTAVGTIDQTLKTVSDYSLCLRCHNTAKNTADSKIADIEKYYTQTTSGHNLTIPTDQNAQDDGSSLNGSIPCAECHNTHGSDNIMNLREQLGNVQLADTNKFKTVGTAWNASNERNFCLSCHNNSTEIYGKTGIFNMTSNDGNLITGHQIGNLQACSSCHGGASKSFIEAAHAPKTATP